MLTSARFLFRYCGSLSRRKGLLHLNLSLVCHYLLITPKSYLRKSGSSPRHVSHYRNNCHGHSADLIENILGLMRVLLSTVHCIKNTQPILLRVSGFTERAIANMKSKKTLVLASIIFWGFSANAADTKYIDMRVMSEKDDYEVHFCFRPSDGIFGKPGHAYVAFALHEKLSKKIQFRAFGATSANITEIFDGDGYLNPEFKSHVRQNCLVAQVNSNLYDKAWETAKPLFSEPEYAYWNYHLTDNSCVDFANSVAESIGLKTNKENVPKNYLKKLISDNYIDGK